MNDKHFADIDEALDNANRSTRYVMKHRTLTGRASYTPLRRPVATDTTTGRTYTRNSPCACGSGKRFKHCCESKIDK